MAIEVVPLPAPPTIDATRFNKGFGREVKGVKPGELTEEQFKEISDLLYKVRTHAITPSLTPTVCAQLNLFFEAWCSALPGYGSDA